MAPRPVCLDPGHGGSDPGAVGPTGVAEKHINLGIALSAGRWLRRQGVDVVMTRKEDVNVSLQERCDIANKAGAVCFVSVHCNASLNSAARGMEVYYCEGSGEGHRLAALLNTYLSSAAEGVELNNRGVKTNCFHVLKCTIAPAALVEVAFISNPAEEAWLNNAANQELVGKAIAKAVCQYLNVPWREEVTPEEAIGWLADKGVITDQDYWKNAVKCVKYLDVLLVKLYRAFIYDNNYTPSKCDALREKKRERELAEYKAKVIAGAEQDEE